MANNKREKELHDEGYNIVAGIDESGMGCFAGDVFVAIVVFPKDIDYANLMPGLNDSKTKTENQRNVLYSLIKKYALMYTVESASVEEIDKLNIYWARFAAVKMGLSKTNPDYILIDGDKEVPNISTPQEAIAKGDSKSISIAAASILAKVERDKHIDSIFKNVHPDYAWDKNKSYYSKDHVDAIKKHGKTKYHREKYVRKYL